MTEEQMHGPGYCPTTPEERRATHVGWNDWGLMAALLRKVGYLVTEPAAAQDGWRPLASAPRVSRVLVGYVRSGVVEIARQWNTPQGWRWVTDNMEPIDLEEDPIGGWMPLPPPVLELHSRCTCSCHAPGAKAHELPCCRADP